METLIRDSIANVRKRLNKFAQPMVWPIPMSVSQIAMHRLKIEKDRGKERQKDVKIEKETKKDIRQKFRDALRQKDIKEWDDRDKERHKAKVQWDIKT